MMALLWNPGKSDIFARLLKREVLPQQPPAFVWRNLR